ncbi:hypothetical protein, partial [Mycobacterium sp.]|uniref:hypothetical protein n=1 Tax=Mycobacterium sp. TaxID=1785 RepID=UPI0033401366
RPHRSPTAFIWWSNLRSAVEQELSRVRHCLTAPHTPPPAKAIAKHSMLRPPRRQSVVVGPQHRIVQHARATPS